MAHTFTNQIPDAQIVDLCDLLDGRTSPWLIATETDLDKATVTVTHAVTPGATPTVVAFTQLLAALAALHDEGELCCAVAMVDDQLGAGCAVDADIVFRRALCASAHR